MNYYVKGDADPSDSNNWYWNLADNIDVVIDAPDYFLNFEDKIGLTCQSTVVLTFTKSTEKLTMCFEETIGDEVTLKVDKTYSATNNQRVRIPGVDEPVEFRKYFYYPEDMPNGEWNLTHTGFDSDKYIQSFITTDANRVVDKYKKNRKGQWEKDGTVPDSGYMIHGGGVTATKPYSPYDNNLSSDTTLGCIRMNNEDMEEMIPYVKAAIDTEGNDAKIKVSN